MWVVEYQWLIGIVFGIASLGFGPYLLVSIQHMIDENEWKMLPYEPKYLGVMLLALVSYTMTYFASAEFRAFAEALTFWQAVSIGISGEKISREAVRLYEVVVNVIKSRGTNPSR